VIECVSSIRRLSACALALALWAGVFGAQSDAPGSGSAPTGRDNQSFSSGDSSGGGELPKTGCPRRVVAVLATPGTG